MSTVQDATKELYRKRIEAREDHIRESWVKAMEVQLVREELEKCRKGEGPNALENCKWLAEKYSQMLQDNKLKGYKIIET
ncbi:hypothetical protein MIND_00222400 [Mycena indigotica]|uniref:NADH-ubiquinone oxidoreductase 12 kDa subunit n=1 Tax=Mycena indigotica TaxID=2126181 RepID=A0A8H6T8D6_9AGAR|nr:uncharacterized protein MIND_00222400 [Mycena indigotica]KAF7312101.1 hypothetical protein MIND_00222400 [Mycena indigotica]